MEEKGEEGEEEGGEEEWGLVIRGAVFFGNLGEFFSAESIIFKVVDKEADFILEERLRGAQMVGAAEGAFKYANPSGRILIRIRIYGEAC